MIVSRAESCSQQNLPACISLAGQYCGDVDIWSPGRVQHAHSGNRALYFPPITHHSSFVCHSIPLMASKAVFPPPLLLISSSTSPSLVWKDFCHSDTEQQVRFKGAICETPASLFNIRSMVGASYFPPPPPPWPTGSGRLTADYMDTEPI